MKKHEYFSVFQYPILKAACVDKGRSWTHEIFGMHSQDTDLYMKVIIMRANINFFLDLMACFHYILNPLVAYKQFDTAKA